MESQRALGTSKGKPTGHMSVTLFDQDFEDAIRILKRLMRARERRSILDKARQIDPTQSASVDDDSNETLARKIFAVQEARLRWLPDVVPPEPGWNLLLALYLANKCGARHTVSHMVDLSQSSQTTALRHINILQDAGLIYRERDDTDRRIFYLLLSEQGVQLMDGLFSDASDG
jgi:DNA-binding transcriptional ArsR family regulator